MLEVTEQRPMNNEYANACISELGYGRQFRYFINLTSLTQDDEENGTR